MSESRYIVDCVFNTGKYSFTFFIIIKYTIKLHRTKKDTQKFVLRADIVKTLLERIVKRVDIGTHMVTTHTNKI